MVVATRGLIDLYDTPGMTNDYLPCFGYLHLLLRICLRIEALHFVT